MAEQLANDVQTLLAADLSAGAVKLQPQSATGFPAAEFRIRVDDELMLVTATGVEWTIERGVEGTTAAAHAAGAPIYHLLTKAALLRTIEELAATDAELATEKSAREAGDALALPKAGGTMTGAIVLPGNPGSNLQAAPKQYVDSAISALVNGAPETFDTLKEISDQLKLDEEAETALIALVAQKLAKSANLGDLLNAATARSNLGLGSAAVEAASAFQPADSDLALIAALTTTEIGRSLLAAANAAAIRTISGAASATHASAHQLGGADALALPQYDPFDLLPYVVPMGYSAGTTTTLTAKRGYHNRFTVARKREFKFVRFGVAVVGTGAEEKWDVAIYKLNGSKLERVASSGYKAVNMTSLGPKAVEMTSTAVCEPGVVYYVSIQPETVTGTPQIVAVISNNANVGDIAGTGTLGNRIFLIRSEAGAFPSSLEGGFSGSQNPWLVPSEV